MCSHVTSPFIRARQSHQQSLTLGEGHFGEQNGSRYPFYRLEPIYIAPEWLTKQFPSDSKISGSRSGKCLV